jgi:CheY-like chemotaxis protein
MRVLLAEDEELLRWSISLALEKAGHFVTAVGTGEEALECLKRSVFEVVITDYKMGTVNGLEVVRAAKACPSVTRVVMMSAWCAELEERLNKKRNVTLLKKPFELHALVSLVAGKWGK